MNNIIDEYWDEVFLQYDIEFEKAYENLKGMNYNDMEIDEACNIVALEKLCKLAIKINRTCHINYWKKWGIGYE